LRFSILGSGNNAGQAADKCLKPPPTPMFHVAICLSIQPQAILYWAQVMKVWVCLCVQLSDGV
jgi:hypothetical protein